MYTIADGSTHGLADVETLLDALSAIEHGAIPEARGLFDPAAELVVTRAPGRLDVMGGIADYSGSLVLEMPIREAARVALQRSAERMLHIVSVGGRDTGRCSTFAMPLARFEADGRPITYGDARKYFQTDAARHWAAYAAGAFLVLMREREMRFNEGARVLVDSDVPEGKGVSSSAALEVAVMRAVAAAFDIPLTPRDLALLCQAVENRVVGAPCGVMDQMTSVLGRADHLLMLLCQPAEVQGLAAVPDALALWGLDCGLRHAVSGDAYGAVRVGAFMGYRIIADIAGLAVEPAGEDEPVRIVDPVYRGYLANVTPRMFEERFASHLPERMSGREFLDRYSGTTDHATRVDPELTYPVRVPTAHPIHEHDRTRAFAEILHEARGEDTLRRLGELMYLSHASYSACGLGSTGTDRLVDLVQSAGPQRGLFGAKITGGGSGGTVAVLGRRDARPAIEAVADTYQRETGYRPHLFSGSSPGAETFGHITLIPRAPG
ncbi:MAG: hypothetical protein JSV19_05310 [Phycisphaerales bacterium]|nr:MAG: hypothetical protein JSV19_05310 [Phycisphaerales bacterium]